MVFLLAGFASPSSAQDGFGLARVLGEPHTPPELRRHLGSLDASAIPSLFLLAAEGTLPGAKPEAELALSDDDRQIVRESLCARPRRELISFLSDRAGADLELAERLEAQRLLAGMGTGDHLKLLVRLTSAPQERGGLVPELRLGFEGALGAMLARDPSALSQIPSLFAESPPGLSGAVIEALSSQRSFAATRTLVALLGRAPGVDPLLLARLATRGRVVASDGEAVFERVRRYLTQRDAGLVAAAALACGQLGDDGAIEGLIDLIDHEDERVRASAFEALSRLSGLDFGHESARWTAWYHGELRWWDEEAESLLIRIERGHGLEFVRAARAALEHRLFRDRIAGAFAVALVHGRGDEVLLACRALQQLRSPVAVSSLIECLDHPDAKVRESAWKALRAITGVELPLEADSWARFEG